MRVPRLYVDAPLGAGIEIELPDTATQHVHRVLRLRPGAPLLLFNGRGGEYRATLTAADKRGAKASVLEHLAIERESPLDLTLLQSLARGERMDFIVQKSTELGVRRMVPVQSEFSVVRLDAVQAARRRTHWQTVAIGACEQCGRNRPPEIGALADLRAAVTPLPADALRLLLAPGATRSLAEVAVGLAAQAQPAPGPDVGAGALPMVALLVGPEGGFSPTELAAATRAGFAAVHLGPRVLRAETAPLAALSILAALAGDLGSANATGTNGPGAATPAPPASHAL